MMSTPILIGISKCLLSALVRFDGGHKRLDFAVDQLAPYLHFQLVSLEIAILLPMPHPGATTDK
ncbi:MAG: hypothetical protein ACSLEM_04990 [Candidatus Malihini olakiniferum]